MARTGHLPAAGAGPLIAAAKLEALEREIRAARALAGGRGPIECGLRDGIGRFGQFCIDRQLAAVMNGDVGTGLFFRAAGRLPFGTAIRPGGGAPCAGCPPRRDTRAIAGRGAGFA